MFCLKNKKEVEQLDTVIKNTEQTEIVVEIHTVNNRTGQEYVYKSENDFGIGWCIVGKWLHISQHLSKRRLHEIAIAALLDFSIVKIIRKEVAS